MFSDIDKHVDFSRVCGHAQWKAYSPPQTRGCVLQVVVKSGWEEESDLYVFSPCLDDSLLDGLADEENTDLDENHTLFGAAKGGLCQSGLYYVDPCDQAPVPHPHA